MDDAHNAIDTMRLIHSAVEQNRGTTIPDWAYRDVLFMLIHYSIASYELLEKKLSEKSEHTVDLFKQYKKHLGAIRYKVLIEGQKLVVPDIVKELLHFNDFSFLTPLVPVYKISRLMKIDWLLKNILLSAAITCPASPCSLRRSFICRISSIQCLLELTEIKSSSALRL